MKIYNTLLLTASLCLTSSIAAQTLTVEITGIKNDQGKILLQLFDSNENYQSNKAYSANMIKAKKGVVSVTFNDLVAGEYAIRYFHDENDNGQLEKNLFGMPVEGYGFSNNAKADFGPVSFDDMKVTITDQNLVTHSSVQY
jgi:uncharacterized protein (DUF2141 family)